MKAQLQKSIITICILSFTCCNIGKAQIQQNNIRVVDTVYTPAGYPNGPLTAKLWLPSITNGAAIVLAHASGSPVETLDIYGNYYSTFGYVVLSIDYYGFFHPSGIPTLYPDPVRAYKTAIEFLRKNSLQFGNYTGKVAGFGFSEGAMHWPQTIIWDNDDAYFGTDPNINDHVDAVFCYYGWYDYYNHLESIFNTPGTFDGLEWLLEGYFSPDPSLMGTKGNPFTNIDNITTPVILNHGTSDQILHYMQSVEFHDSLVAHGKYSKLFLFPGGDHAFDNHSSNDPLHNQNNQFTADGIIARDSALAIMSALFGVVNIHCPYNKSYWKNHPAEWSADALPMKLGTTNYYTKPQLLALLNQSAGNDPSKKLAQELIAAKLNLANNSYAPPIVSTITSADNLIGNRTIPIVPLIPSNSSQGNQMTALGNTLNSYNNGSMTPNCNNGGNRMAQNISSDNFSLSIFPNPVSNSTTISFSLPQSGKVSLKIYDVSGRLVATIADKIFEEGENKIEWSAANVNAGIYFLQFQSAENLQTEKLIVTK